MITRQFGIPVTSPGAILRREKDLGTPLGKKTAEVLQSGGLVSDKIIIELIEDWLRLHGGHGFVFDGFPRTLRQAESLTSILARLRTALDLAIWLEVSEQTVRDRTSERRRSERATDSLARVPYQDRAAGIVLWKNVDTASDRRQPRPGCSL